MEPTRIVKVALPARLVAAMDDVVSANPGYDERATFLADAVEGLLAELSGQPGGEPEAHVMGAQRLMSDVESASRSMSLAPPAPLAIVAPADDIPVAGLPTDAPSEPTWGMHNRDWPTLWAASRLGQISRQGPVAFEQWAGPLAEDAFHLAEASVGTDLDLSGFPANRDKRERSLGRFRGFFVGAWPDGKQPTGPLFELGLAAPVQRGTVLLTPPGADLLRGLDGLEPRKGTRVRAEWRHAFLTFLSAWVPADFEFLRLVVAHLVEGHTSRMDLLQAVGRERPEWSENNVATNVAGFIARGREWNLIEPSQDQGRYVVVADAAAALDEAARAAPEARAHYL